MADPSRSSPTAGDAPLAAPATDAPDAALAAAAPDPDAEFGFQRPELGKEKLTGTVGFHERHVFLCYKGPEVWPSRLEAAESDRLPRLLAAAIKARKPNLKKTTKLTICEGEDGTESSNGDVLIFPDMIRYKGLTHFDVDNFVEEVLVKDTEWLPGSPEAISGSYVFVCSHGSRDKRCGVCGPALVKRFKEEIDGLGLDGHVAVSACSHVGGHKYAGNIIIFSSDAKGEVTGHWYGYVVPDDVPVLLHKHIGQGEIVDHLWRGQMGLSEEQQQKALELRNMTNGGSSKETGTDGASCNPATAGGCCQGNGGFTCCQSADITFHPSQLQREQLPCCSFHFYGAQFWEHDCRCHIALHLGKFSWREIRNDRKSYQLQNDSALRRPWRSAPSQDGGRVPSGDLRNRISRDGRCPRQRLPFLRDGPVQLRRVHGSGHVGRDQEARLIRPLRRRRSAEGGVEARVIGRGGGGGHDGRAGGGDAGGVLLAGVGVPRREVPRREDGPQGMTTDASPQLATLATPESRWNYRFSPASLSSYVVIVITVALLSYL